jgi:glutamate racemase
VLAGGSKDVLVMATAVTLALDKYHRLAERWAKGTGVRTAACIGLAKRVERGHLDAPDLIELLERLIGEHRGHVDRVVLGCTHYPFVRDQISQVLGDVRFFDGGLGTARRLHSLLQERGWLADAGHPGCVSFASSNDTPEQLDLYRAFFELEA